MSKKKLIQLLVFNLAFIGVMYFVYASVEWSEVSKSWGSISIIHLLFASICFVLFYILQAIAWYYLLQIYTKDRIKEETSISFFASQMFKYLPSSAFTLSFRIYYAKKQGVRISHSTKVVLVESFIAIVTAAVLFSFVWNIYLGVVLVIITLASYYIYKYIHELKNKPKFISKILPPSKFSFRDYSVILGLYLLSWIISGVALYIFAQSFGNFDPINIIAFQSGSYAASILAVFAPGGLGVKEYFLSLSALTDGIFILWRVVTIVLDLLVSLIGIVFIEYRQKEK